MALVVALASMAVALSEVAAQLPLQLPQQLPIRHLLMRFLLFQAQSRLGPHWTPMRKTTTTCPVYRVARRLRARAVPGPPNTRFGASRGRTQQISWQGGSSSVSISTVARSLMLLLLVEQRPAQLS